MKKGQVLTTKVALCLGKLEAECRAALIAEFLVKAFQLPALADQNMWRHCTYASASQASMSDKNPIKPSMRSAIELNAQRLSQKS